MNLFDKNGKFIHKIKFKVKPRYQEDNLVGTQSFINQKKEIGIKNSNETQKLTIRKGKMKRLNKSIMEFQEK